MLLALVFAYASSRHPAAGGPYAYAREGFGDFMGFQTAWNYWVGAWVGGPRSPFRQSATWRS